MEMNVKEEHVEAAKNALKKACVKLPGTEPHNRISYFPWLR